MDVHVELSNDELIPQDTDFVIVVANGELSPGSVMTLGDQQYNVVEYQVMIHKALHDWDGSSDITDDNGNSLIFSARGLADIFTKLRTNENEHGRWDDRRCAHPLPTSLTVPANSSKSRASRKSL